MKETTDFQPAEAYNDHMPEEEEEDFLTDLYYKIAFCLYKLNRFVDGAEYEIGNFFDPLPKPKKKETVGHYVLRLTPRQSIRHTLYNYRTFIDLIKRANLIDYSIYSKKEKELVFKLTEINEYLCKVWKNLYFESKKRLQKSS